MIKIMIFASVLRFKNIINVLVILLLCFCIFSSPEHEVLMVSYCGQWLSVVRRRVSCVVCRVSSVVRQHLMFTLYRPHL